MATLGVRAYPFGSNDAAFNTFLSAANITPSLLNTGAASNTISTGESTTSTTYAALTTAGPSVTVTIGSNGLALVALGSNQYESLNDQQTFHSVELSGANTLAAADVNGFSFGLPSVGGGMESQASRVFLLTGLTQGVTTFTSQYRVSGGTGTFSARQLAVIPL